MKTILRISMWIILGIISFIAVVAIMLFNWQSITNFKIGQTMNKFSEVTTSWTDIDFTVAVEGETPYLTFSKQTPYPALAKYKINGILSIKNAVLVYGSNYYEKQAIWNSSRDGIYFVEENEQAYIFSSNDNGKTFEKISLGHGIVRNILNVNDILYTEIYEQDTKNIRYYSSVDLGKTWVSNDWKPSFAWYDGTMFIENEERTHIVMSQDNGVTWHPLDSILKEFYTETKMLSLFQRSLRQLNNHIIVGMNEKEEFLFLDLKTMKIEKKVFETPENQEIVGFTINNNQLALELKEYTIPDQTKPPFDSGGIQTSYYFPETKEYVNLPKHLPYHIYWNIQDNYIGGFMKYGSQSFGIPVHVYTLDRGKEWKYEILDKYSFMSAYAYIDGQLWFVAAKDSAANVFLTKGELK